MAHKMRSSEVNDCTLKPDEKDLFDEAKAKEINDFLGRRATKACEAWEGKQAK